MLMAPGDGRGLFAWEAATLPAPPEVMFAGPGCPLCRAARAAEDQHLSWFLHESHASGPTLQRLMSCRYCLRHAGQLAAGCNRQLSMTFHWLAQGELERLRRWRPGRRRALPTGTRTAEEPAGCLACAAGRRAAAVAGAEMGAALVQPRHRDAYTRSDGLCQPHLWQVVREAPEPAAAWLAADGARRLEELIASLDLYIHRLDHRFAHEPRGAEQSAWRRGLARFWMVPDASERGSSQ
jgi:hypothetical protein